MWGLPCPLSYNSSGALLPHLFTLTPAGLAVQASLKSPSGDLSEDRVAEAVFSLWHWPSLSLETQIPDVIRHTALRSSDFPPPVYSSRRNRQRPPSSLADSILTDLNFMLEEMNFQRFQDKCNLLSEFRNVLLNHVPENLKIDCPVSVR